MRRLSFHTGRVAAAYSRRWSSRTRHQNSVLRPDSYRYQSLPDLARNREAALRLIEYPLESFTPETWFEAEELLPWWSVQRTPESVDLSFQLLERLLQEPSIQLGQWLDAETLNRLINNWRVVWWDSTLPNELAPAMVLQRVLDYHANGLAIDEKTLYLILEADVTAPKDASQTPQFARRILNTALVLASSVPACQPSTELCNLVLTAVAQAANQGEATAVVYAKECEDVIAQMMQHEIPLNRRTYARVIYAWSLTASVEGALAAQEWLAQMYADFQAGDRRARPTTAAFASVIAAWARSGAEDAGARGEQILEQWSMLRKELLGGSPVKAVNAVMQCYANQGTLEAAQRAHALFHKYLTKKHRPDYVSYLTLLSAWANVGQPEPAQALVEELTERYRTSAGSDLKPDVAIYTTLVKAWAKSSAEDKVEQALRLIQFMQEQKDEEMMPNLVTYNILLDCLANTTVESFGNGGTPGTKAEALLEEMRARAAAGQDDVRPDVISYSSAMHAWAKIGHAERAAQILDQMLQDYRSGNARAKPDVQCFNTVLGAFTRSRATDACLKAEAFLKRMQDEGIEPNVYSYTSVIAAFAKSTRKNRKESARRAAKWLQQMQSAYENGNARCRPNRPAYNAVMNAFARGGRPERAEQVLQEMYLDYLNNGNHQARPDTSSFNTLLKAWAYSRSPEAPAKAEELMSRMKEIGLRPNFLTYSTLMLVYGLARPPHPQRAEDILREMDRLYERNELDERPNRRNYQTVRKAWLYSTDSHRKAKAAAIRTEMEERFGSGAN